MTMLDSNQGNISNLSQMVGCEMETPPWHEIIELVMPREIEYDNQEILYIQFQLLFFIYIMEQGNVYTLEMKYLFV